MPPTFSVIIPVYNRSHMVQQAIDSTLAQGLEDYEIIVVDDGSTDDTLARLQGYGSRIRLLQQSNQGPEIARNEGARAARGDYLCFLDSDDQLLPWALQTYRKVIEATAHPALILAQMVYFSSLNPYPVDPRRRVPIHIAVYPDILSKDRPAAYSFSAFVVERRALAAAGGMRRGNPHMFQGDDLDFVLRMGLSGPVALLLQPATVAYRHHDHNSLQDFRQLVEGFRINIEDDAKQKFPGGTRRRADRHALIGGCLGYWVLNAVRAGYWRSAFDLVAMGYPMLIARLIKAVKIKRAGRSVPLSLGPP